MPVILILYYEDSMLLALVSIGCLWHLLTVLESSGQFLLDEWLITRRCQQPCMDRPTTRQIDEALRLLLSQSALLHFFAAQKIHFLQSLA